MMRLQSDLVEHCLSALDHSLDQQTATWDSRYAVGVVLAAGGYPHAYAREEPISGLDGTGAEHQKIFHAGTKLSSRDSGQQVLTNGGRVLCATALGDTVSAAQAAAYELVHQIRWDKVYFRTDIAYRAIARENG